MGDKSNHGGHQGSIIAGAGCRRMRSAETISRIVNAIADNFSPHKILLFGSYAYGNPTADSDLDLLLVMDTDLPKHKRATPIRLLFRPAPCALDLLVYTPEEVARWNGTVNHIITEVLGRGKSGDSGGSGAANQAARRVSVAGVKPLCSPFI